MNSYFTPRFLRNFPTSSLYPPKRNLSKSAWSSFGESDFSKAFLIPSSCTRFLSTNHFIVSSFQSFDCVSFLSIYLHTKSNGPHFISLFPKSFTIFFCEDTLNDVSVFQSAASIVKVCFDDQSFLYQIPPASSTVNISKAFILSYTFMFPKFCVYILLIL